VINEWIIHPFIILIGEGKREAKQATPAADAQVSTMRGSMFCGGDLRWWMLAIFFLCTLIAAAEERVVTHLPGFQGPLPFQLRTGSALHVALSR
jgi:hypothetical protein